MDRIKGCLLGGAVGDALGGAVEFLSLAEIRTRFGPDGIADFAPAYGRTGAITDDTQMTLFTAEGLLRAHVRGATKGITDTPSVVHHAYLRWLLTQNVKPRIEIATDGWLFAEERLFSRRAPGNTCLSALGAATALGEPAQNDSKGCGTVMRVAPIGLALRDHAQVFALGVETSALTHGHPAGSIAGGAFALLFTMLLDGMEVRPAIDAMMKDVRQADVVRAVEGALALTGEPTAEKVESLGGGWVAEEALAIALYCALHARDFEHGVRLAANHSGDADSTASMTGQILGAMQGPEVIPERWLKDLELRDVLERVAADLTDLREGRFAAEKEASRYPGT